MPSEWPTDEQGRPTMPSPSSNMMQISDELVDRINTPIERKDWPHCSHTDDALYFSNNGERIRCLDCQKEWTAVGEGQA